MQTVTLGHEGIGWEPDHADEGKVSDRPRRNVDRSQGVRGRHTGNTRKVGAGARTVWVHLDGPDSLGRARAERADLSATCDSTPWQPLREEL